MERRFTADIRSGSESRPGTLKHAVSVSFGQGGTMLKILPFAESGVSPSEIARVLGISYQSVVSSQKHLRRWGLIPESRVQRTHRLLSELSQLQDSFEARQGILDAISFRFYRDNPKYFVTFTTLLRAARRSSRIGDERLAVFLKSNEIANRLFRSNNYNYGVILKAEDQRAQEVLEQLPIGSTNSS